MQLYPWPPLVPLPNKSPTSPPARALRKSSPLLENYLIRHIRHRSNFAVKCSLLFFSLQQPPQPALIRPRVPTQPFHHPLLPPVTLQPRSRCLSPEPPR